MTKPLFATLEEVAAHNARIHQQQRERRGLITVQPCVVDTQTPILLKEPKRSFTLGEIVAPTITCEVCGKVCPRRGAMQKYCEVCSAKKDLERKSLWAREHPLPPGSKKEYNKTATNQRRALGALRNDAERETYGIPRPPDLAWLVRIAVPFHASVSKNHIYSAVAAGHRFLRGESRQFRNALRDHLVLAMGSRKAVPNKVWLDIYVEKPNHKMDAINTVDLVCDGVKEALGIDDRWFCIRRLDWQIVKSNPRIFVGVGQEDVVASQVCSYCGAIRPLTDFGTHKTSSTGRHRVCHQCSSIVRKS